MPEELSNTEPTMVLFRATDSRLEVPSNRGLLSASHTSKVRPRASNPRLETCTLVAEAREEAMAVDTEGD